MYDITIVPPEVWLNIFTLACTDGGRTGSCVALSCKFFHSQSSRVRCHSVRLSSIESVEQFLAFARLRPKGQRPIVCHLSLTMLSGLKVRRAFLSSSYPGSDLTAEKQRQAEGKRRALQARFIDAANELFVLVAPTLRTLCITTGYFLPLAPLPCDMPVLEELTMMGSISTIKGTNKQSRLPMLKRFHLIPRSATADMDVRTTALTASALCTAPLTHIRLSNVSAYERPDLSSLLTRTLGVCRAEDYSTQTLRDRAQAILPGIREVVVHTLIPDLGWCGNAHMVYLEESAAFEGFARACNDVDGLHVVALSRQQRNFRWKERLYNDWVSRIEGGGGCWARDAAEETALEMRVAREGDVFHSMEDKIHSWSEDDFSGGDGGHHIKDALADLLNAGECGGVLDRGGADDPNVPHGNDPDELSRTDLRGYVGPSSPKGAVSRGSGRRGWRGKCTLM
ncbi:hypothetical protein OH76DRAFT_1401972 [Lentinus brumalis]|uniref:Uncharacterized protein n=1 Tax=Lentinus brumalis TaxID=2498619 RepID=A0A371DF83_9APHY|nr:hypothetical protein OH76DRAFT_1401972 [Polyporus brumalis]